MSSPEERSVSKRLEQSFVLFYGLSPSGLLQWQTMRTKRTITGVVFLLVFLFGNGRAGPPGKGVVLDGTVAFRVAGKDVPLSAQALTVACWVRADRLEDSGVFLNVGRANNVFTLYYFKDNVRMLIGHQKDAYTHARADLPVKGEWTHYAGTYDGKEIRLYANGKLAMTTQAQGKMETPGSPLFLGSLNERERFLVGALEDVRVWNRTLSQEEVSLLVSDPEASSNLTGLLGRWMSKDLGDKEWTACDGRELAAERIEKKGLLMNEKANGYWGIWYSNQPVKDSEYVYKYSGGLGTYCAKHIPHAWYCKEADKTFFTYGGALKDDSSRLFHMVSYYDHKTGKVPRPTILLDKETSDAHDNPVISMDSEGYIWIFSSSHGTSRPSYISRSLKPLSIDAFELMWTGNYSYPHPWPMGDKGWILMHTHYTGGRAIAMMTSKDGKNWTERRFLCRMDQGHYQISRRFKHEKVGSAYNYHPKGPGISKRTNLYYMESDDLGNTWKTVDGQPLEPILTDPGCPALVHDFQSQGLNVYMKDITFDEAGRPIILFLTSKGNLPGPENGPRIWRTARWTGEAWDLQGEDIVSDNNYDMGSLYVEKDLWRIVAPTETGPQAFNPGGEVALWESQDWGASWKKVRQMTRNSQLNHTYVRRPVNVHSGFYGFWADGHGRHPSESRLYFCNRDGDVFRLPQEMKGEWAVPEQVAP